MNGVLQATKILNHLSVVNASVNMSAGNCVKSLRVLDKNPIVSILCCHCHTVHNHVHADGSILSLVYSPQKSMLVGKFSSLEIFGVCFTFIKDEQV